MIEAADTSQPAGHDETFSGRGHGHKPRERRDIASGDVKPRAHMIRMAFGPDGLVVPDLAQKLPGRGAWVAADRASIELAVKKGAFARAAKQKVNVPDGFADLIAAGLSSRVLSLLGMAKRAGEVETGFDKVRGAALGGQLAFRFEASDGKPDGRGKIRTASKSASYELSQPFSICVGCFDGHALGKVLGRDHMVHVGVRHGRLAKALRLELSRLAGFVDLLPLDWPDREHEQEFVPFAAQENAVSSQDE